MSCLYILEIKPLSVTSFANIFSQAVGCIFLLFMVSFAVQKRISLIRSHLFIFAFVSIALGVNPSKCAQEPNVAKSTRWKSWGLGTFVQPDCGVARKLWELPH